MTDREKVEKLFDELGIKHTEEKDYDGKDFDEVYSLILKPGSDKVRGFSFCFAGLNFDKDGKFKNMDIGY